MRSLIIFAFLYVISIQLTRAQIIESKCIITPIDGTIDGKDMVFDDDDLNIRVGSMFSKFWRYTIKNKSGNNISLNWKKSSFVVDGEALKVVKGDSKVFEINDGPIDDQLPEGSIIRVDLLPINYYNLGSSLANRKHVQNIVDRTGKPRTVKLLISYNKDGEEINRTIQFTISPK